MTGDRQTWRVLDTLLQAVRDGEYPAGGDLPVEADLALTYGVSRGTVSRVMWLLRWAGLVVGPSGVPGRIAGEPSRTLALQLVERAYEVRRLHGPTNLLGAAPRRVRDCLPDDNDRINERHSAE
jgi:DNA-binding FadR family transcriptional regulator